MPVEGGAKEASCRGRGTRFWMVIAFDNQYRAQRTMFFLKKKKPAPTGEEELIILDAGDSERHLFIAFRSGWERLCSLLSGSGVPGLKLNSAFIGTVRRK